MSTQEIWFPEIGIDWPSHGMITDGVAGAPCTVIVYATGEATTPSEHPTLHTILDPGQPIPALLQQARALGFTVTYHLHGDELHAINTLPAIGLHTEPLPAATLPDPAPQEPVDTNAPVSPPPHRLRRN